MQKNKYSVIKISEQKKESIVSKLDFSSLYQRKASIHGTCIKLFCQNPEFVDMWDENFRMMNEDIRPHARIFSLSDSSKQLKVLFESESKTVFIYNCEYYGWVKSLALSLASEYLFDSPSVESRRYSIHGSYVDFLGRGIAIMGMPKAGKTTLTYGLLASDKSSSFLTDDWFFVRFMGEGVRVFSAEKNSYAGSDIAQNWPELISKIKNLKKDGHGRAIMDVSRLFGQTRIRNQSEFSALVILTRNPSLPAWSSLSKKEALSLLSKWDFCNPHQLTRTPKRKKAQIQFFSSLLERIPVYLLNTIETPAKSLERLNDTISAIKP